MKKEFAGNKQVFGIIYGYTDSIVKILYKQD